MTFLANALNNLPFSQISRVTFTSNGTYTPPIGTNYVYVEVLGGGGSGGRASATSGSTCAYAGGGSTKYGTGGKEVANSNSGGGRDANSGTLFGAGGSGAASGRGNINARAGGNGTNGVVYIWKII